jgi:hypothetical protein
MNTSYQEHDSAMIKKQLVKGCRIVYRLKPSQLPTDEKRLWHGLVLHTMLGRMEVLDSVIVTLLEPGYEEETEVVFLEQIIDVYNEPCLE